MFQSEAKWEIIDMKVVFYFHANKTHFHNQGFALSLVLKVIVFGTPKCPIVFCLLFSLTIRTVQVPEVFENEVNSSQFPSGF